MKKIVNLKNFLLERKKLKKQKKKLIVTNGCFDILHPGHIKIFEKSKKMGDRLLVLLNSDKSIKMNKGSIWFLFILVTLIQLIGNVFYEYKEISLNESGFLSWVELISPWFEDWELLDHRRLLALIQGGTLPIMSLTSLHFYIQFNDNLKESHEIKNEPIKENDNLEEYAKQADSFQDIENEEAIGKVLSKNQSEDTLFETSNISDPNRYINKTDHDLKVSKGTHKKSDERPQKNWGK